MPKRVRMFHQRNARPRSNRDFKKRDGQKEMRRETGRLEVVAVCPRWQSPQAERVTMPCPEIDCTQERHATNRSERNGPTLNASSQRKPRR